MAMLATVLGGLVGVRAAGATTQTLTLSQTSGLTDGQAIDITAGGINTDPRATPMASMQFSECANAYANGDPLGASARDTVNCSVIVFRTAGQVTTDPLMIDSVPVLETGIGTGNRSCVAAANFSCFVYVSASVNEPPFPSQDISFGTDATGMTPAPTTTTIVALGSPLGADKPPHAAVTVSTGVHGQYPEGPVSVYEGATLLGTQLLVDGTVNVPLGPLSLNDHTLRAQYDGDGSFLGSNSADTTMTIIVAENISIGDAAIVEGNSGQRQMQFPVVLSHALVSGAGVNVNYSIAGSGPHPASAGSDFVNVSGVLKFKLNQTVKYLKVKINGDSDIEFDETFSDTLASPTNGYVLRRAAATGTIIDDDTTPVSGVSVGIGSASVPEGDAGGPRSLSLPLTISGPISTETVSVSIEIASVNATHGTKTSGDWGGKIDRVLVFKANQLYRPVNIAVYPDLIDEPDETVSVTIKGVTVSGLTPVTIGPNFEATGTILTDE